MHFPFKFCEKKLHSIQIINSKKIKRSIIPSIKAPIIKQIIDSETFHFFARNPEKDRKKNH